MGANKTGLISIALGLVLILAAGTLFSPVIGAAYTIPDVEQTDSTEIDTVQYAELPPAGQQAFRAALEDRESVTLTLKRDHQAIQLLQENQGIVYEGDIYEHDLVHGDGSQSGVVRALIVTVGATLIGIGLPMVRTNRFRPLTTRTAIITGAIPLLSLVSLTVWEQVIQSGNGISFVFGAALPASFLAVVTGVAVRRADMAGVALSSALAIGTVLVSALLGWDSLVTLLFVPLLSMPWFALGYLLAQPMSEITASSDGRFSRPE